MSGGGPVRRDFVSAYPADLVEALAFRNYVAQLEAAKLEGGMLSGWRLSSHEDAVVWLSYTARARGLNGNKSSSLHVGKNPLDALAQAAATVLSLENAEPTV